MTRFEQGMHALRSLPLVELAPMIGIPAYWLVFLVVFLLWAAVRGMPRTGRISEAGSGSVPRVLAEYGYWQFSLPVRVFVKLGVTPNAVSILSGVTALGAGVLFALGYFSAGGWTLTASAACDAMDGMVARATNTCSDRGEYLDSFIDRYSDFFVMLGLLYYYRNDLLPAAIVAAGMIGSNVMGYAKAKGEAVGVNPKVGYMQRQERCTWLIVGAVLSPIAAAFIEPGRAHPTHHLALVALGAIAVLSNISAVWRGAYVMQRMARPGAPSPTVASAAEPQPAAPAPGEGR